MSNYTQAVDDGLEGLKFPSVGPCPGCETCKTAFGFKTLKEFDRGYAMGKISDDGGFSWSPCGICGTQLGGDRYVWHWVDDDDNIAHADNCCVDCLVYLANGDEPENWPS